MIAFLETSLHWALNTQEKKRENGVDIPLSKGQQFSTASFEISDHLRTEISEQSLFTLSDYSFHFLHLSPILFLSFLAFSQRIRDPSPAAHAYD